MSDDVRPPARKKPKTIEPLKKPESLGSFVLPKEWEEDSANMTSHLEPSNDDVDTTAAEPTEKKAVTSEHQKTNLWHKITTWPPTKQQKIIGSCVIVLLAFGVGAGWAVTHKRPTAQAVVTKAVPKKAVKAEPIYSTLSGLPITDASINNRPVSGVMIENSLDARPQSGLGQAGVVFEAVAEGGVTRFLALFQDTAPDNVGPIRSARPYYVSWNMGFDASYAHVGGSPEALNDISAWGTKDLNQFSNGDYYHRTADRYAPHNVYTGISTLNQLESKKGYGSKYTGFVRKADAPSKTPNASAIDMRLSGYYYDPHFDYDAASNSYKRSEAGQPHMDANTNTQITPKVVIGLVVPLAQGALDSSGAYYSNYNVIGSGQAYVFQDGTFTVGTWTKTDNAAPLTFTDAAGKPLPLNRGQTWITAVSSNGNISYQ